MGSGTVIESRAVVGPYTVLGNDCYVGKGSKVAYTVTWDYVEIGENSTLEKDVLSGNVKVGDNVHINENVIIGEGVIIEDNVKIENDITITPHKKVSSVNVIKVVIE